MLPRQKPKYCIDMQDVFDAKVNLRNNIHVTPVTKISNIERLTNCNLSLKLEFMQRTRSYKFRGAYNLVSKIPKGKTIAAASKGNQSQAIALASSITGVPNVLYLPETTTASKIESTKHYNGNVVLKGKDFHEADSLLQEDCKQHKDWVYASPFDDANIIAANATIGVELIEQLPEIDTIVVPVGGGGLIAGIAYAIKNLKPSVRVIGTQPATNAAVYKAFQESRGKEATGISHEKRTPLADGAKITTGGELTQPIINDFVDEIVIINEDEIALAVAILADKAKAIVEGSAATTFAAVYNHRFDFKPDENVCCLLSSGNIELRMLNRCIERALFLQRERVSISIVVPYGTNYFSRLLTMLASHNAEVVTCTASAHIETSANNDQYRIIIDVPRPEIIKEIEEDCKSRNWHFSEHPFSLIGGE